MTGTLPPYLLGTGDQIRYQGEVVTVLDAYPAGALREGLRIRNARGVERLVTVDSSVEVEVVA